MKEKYEYYPNHYGKKYHAWSIETDLGAAHLHITDCGEDAESYGGIELHFRSPPSHMKGRAPLHNCKLVGGVCWHDGSSLGVQDDVRFFESCRNNLPHDYFFGVVRSWMIDHKLMEPSP